MDQQILLKLCLDNEFYTANKNKILDVFFDGKLKSVWDTVKSWHETFNRTATLEELKLYFDTSNPVANKALKDALKDLIEGLDDVGTIGNDLGREVIANLYRAERAREIGELSSKIITGELKDFDAIQHLLKDQDTGPVEEDKLVPVSDELDDIIAGVDNNVKWFFNIPSLRDRVPGIGPGIFTLLFARPEVGKTASWVSLTSGMEGFCHQGAKVAAFINEEPAIRTKARCVTAACNNSFDWVKEHKEEAGELFGKIKDKIKCYDVVGMNMEDLAAFAKNSDADILVLDQLDKFNIRGSYARDDQKLRAIYVMAREIAKEYQKAVIAISQASAEADGQSRMNFTWLENSKTGKAAEVDLAIGIGYNPAYNNERLRHFTLCKNKISGNHDYWAVYLEPEKGVYRD